MKIIATNKQETEKAGAKLAASLKGGDVVCLQGELGAGKTTLVKGLARGLGVKNEITSPTFALMNIYPVKSRKAGISAKPKLFNRVNKNIKTFIHIDTYRLKNEQELIDIGVEDYLGAPDTICAIEWPEKIEGLLKKKKIVRVTIEHAGEKRKIGVKRQQ